MTLTSTTIQRIFLDQQTITKHLFCSICHEIFENPNRLECGHTFCYFCIQSWARLCKACPMCKKSLKKRPLEKDLIAASIIDDLRTKCSHKNCSWQGVYSVLKKHQRDCKYKLKRQFQLNDLNEVVELNDDLQVKQIIQDNKKGNKKLKVAEIQNLPTFQSSSNQSSTSEHNFANKEKQNTKKDQSSSQKSQYLQIDPRSLIMNRSTLQKQHYNSVAPRNCITEKIQNSSFNYNIFPNLNNSSKKLQKSGYPQKRAEFSERLINNSFSLDQKQLQKQDQVRNWRFQQNSLKKGIFTNKVHIYSEKSQKEHINKQQIFEEDNSQQENPFDSPIIQRAQENKNEIIIIDQSQEDELNISKQKQKSSKSSKSKQNLIFPEKEIASSYEKQSGQMSVSFNQLYKPSNTPINDHEQSQINNKPQEKQHNNFSQDQDLFKKSKMTSINQNVCQNMTDHQKIKRQLKQLIFYKPQIDAVQRKKQRNLSSRQNSKEINFRFKDCQKQQKKLQIMSKK